MTDYLTDYLHPFCYTPGYPLSPALFALPLALEPLAILIGNSSRVRGLRVGSLEEKISLYADDDNLSCHAANPISKSL